MAQGKKISELTEFHPLQTTMNFFSLTKKEVEQILETEEATKKSNFLILKWQSPME